MEWPLLPRGNDMVGFTILHCSSLGFFSSLEFLWVWLWVPDLARGTSISYIAFNGHSLTGKKKPNKQVASEILRNLALSVLTNTVIPTTTRPS